MIYKNDLVKLALSFSKVLPVLKERHSEFNTDVFFDNPYRDFISSRVKRALTLGHSKANLMEQVEACICYAYGVIPQDLFYKKERWLNPRGIPDELLTEENGVWETRITIRPEFHGISSTYFSQVGNEYRDIERGFIKL